MAIRKTVRSIENILFVGQNEINAGGVIRLVEKRLIYQIAQIIMF